MLPGSTGLLCDDCRGRSTLCGRLRLLGVLQNKHIPPVYLRASVAQRRALLAGLLDTGGTVTAAGAVEFTNTNERLAHDVLELARSLGYRARSRAKRPRLNGRDCEPAWTISFTTVDPVFWLTRKKEAHAARTSQYSSARNRYRYIVAVRPVPARPVRCIRVSASSQLFLAGQGMIPTHNSVLLKKLSGDLVDRGGRLLTIDRTQTGEWAKLADALTDASIVSAQAPTVSLDPLRLMPGPTGARICQSFLTALLNVQPTSAQGRLLSDVLDPRWLARNEVDSLGGLTARLATQGDNEAELASYLRTFATKDIGQVIFNENLPPLDLQTRAIVFGTAGLQMPGRDELLNDHLFRQLSLEKVFGRAYYALVLALIRQAAFADPGELVAVALDEAHHVTNSPESQHEVTELIRDGRKHKAAILLGSHDPAADFGSDTLQALIPTRLVARQRDKALAQRSLQWLGLDPEDPGLIELLTKHTSPVNEDINTVPPARRGEMFMRDSRGRIGRVKILPPALPARALAVLTTPPRSRNLTS